MPSTAENRNLLHRLAKGIAANGFAQIVGLVYFVVSVPFFLRSWGADLYGEWILLSLIPTYLAISDFGFGNAAGTEMTLRVARGDRDGARMILQSIWSTVTVLSSGVALLLVAIIGVVPLVAVLHLKLLSDQEARAIAVLLVLQVCLSQQGAIIDSVYKCDGHYATGVLFLNFARLAEFVAGIAVLVLGGDPWHYALAFTTVKAVSYALIWLDLHRRVPWARVGWEQAEMAFVRPLIKPALGFVATPLAFALSVQGMSYVVTLVYAPAIVTLYSLHRTLARLVWQLGFAVSNASTVEVSRALGAGDLALARKIHRRVWQVVLWLTVVAGVGLVLVAPLLYSFWTRKQVSFDPLLMGVLIAVSIVGCLWGVGFTVPVSQNKHHRLTFAFLIVSLLSLVLSYPLMLALGLVGGGLALLVGEATMLYIATRTAWKMLDEEPGDFLRNVLVPPVDLFRRAFRRKSAPSE